MTIKMLIGSDYYWDIIDSQKIKISNGLYLISSKLGYILTGRIQTVGTTKNIITNLNITENYQDFWNLDTIGIKDNPTVKDDDLALDQFNKTIKLVNKRYEVNWPWKDEKPNLPDNFFLALGRLKSLLRKLSTNPEFMVKYNDIIQDQFNKGIIEKVTTIKSQNKIHYIPHQAVITPLKSTTKIRIVYDASAKTKKDNPSLNDCFTEVQSY